MTSGSLWVKCWDGPAKDQVVPTSAASTSVVFRNERGQLLHYPVRTFAANPQRNAEGAIVTVDVYRFLSLVPPDEAKMTEAYRNGWFRDVPGSPIVIHITPEDLQ